MRGIYIKRLLWESTCLTIPIQNASIIAIFFC